MRTTEGSFLTSNLELIAIWSDPLVMTMGRKHCLVSVMGYDSCTTVSNLSILGYMSKGLIVPLVMMTEEKRSKTGWMAKEASRQVKWKIGLGTVAFSVSKGSRMRRKPCE